MAVTPEMLIVGLLMFIAGVLVGTLCTLAIKKTKSVGTFTINHSDPAKDFCTLHLDYDIDVIEKQKVIGLKVQVK